MTRPSWSAAQYVKYESERNRPIRDLLDKVSIAQVDVAADLGCGPGNSTEILQARFPNARITGIDSSSDMIEAARRRLPDIRFAVDDVATWDDRGPFDLILANAVLQWVPEHASLLPALISKLAAGGVLAVQMPDNLDQPVQLLMNEIAADGPWSDKLAEAAKSRAPVHDVEHYYRILRETAVTVDIWRTTYYHPLSGDSAIVEWFKGTGLRPYLDRLDENDAMAFLARYQAAIDRAYPALPDGTVLLAFPRLFIVARR